MSYHLGMSTLRALPDAPASLTERVAEEVRAYMGRRQMTQVQLAQILGLPQSAVSSRVRGKIPFRVDELQTVAEALGIHPAVLLGGNSPSPSGPITGAYPVESNTLSHDNWLENGVGFRSEPDVMRLTRTAAAA